MSIEKLDTSQSAVDEGEDPASSTYDNSTEVRNQRHVLPRWMLTFKDENEAQRFIRNWHRKAFPSARGDGPRLVYTEFLW